MYKEGAAKIYTKSAFINDKARLLRDISVAMAYMNSEKSNALDATAATGIRGIRYFLESGFKKITFLEINKNVYNTLLKNVSSNKVDGNPVNQSIQEFANTSKESFDLIDLDPFGGIQPYIYDLMKISKDGTLFFVTSTDTAVLCGAHKNACIRLYNSVPMHNEICHETGLRIMIGYIAAIAAGFNFGIEMYLSMSYKHYMRVHLKMNHGAKNAMVSLKELGFARYCNNCGFRNYKRGIPEKEKCRYCGSSMELSGPMWLGPLHNKKIVDDVIAIIDRNKGLTNSEKKVLKEISDELDIPLYYSVPKLTKRLGIASISPSKVIESLRQKGYMASLTHFDNNSIKTNAEFDVIKNSILENLRQ